MPRPHPPEFRRRAVELARSDKFLDLFLREVFSIPRMVGIANFEQVLFKNRKIGLMQSNLEIDAMCWRRIANSVPSSRSVKDLLDFVSEWREMRCGERRWKNAGENEQHCEPTTRASVSR